MRKMANGSSRDEDQRAPTQATGRVVMPHSLWGHRRETHSELRDQSVTCRVFGQQSTHFRTLAIVIVNLRCLKEQSSPCSFCGSRARHSLAGSIGPALPQGFLQVQGGAVVSSDRDPRLGSSPVCWQASSWSQFLVNLWLDLLPPWTPQHE